MDNVQQISGNKKNKKMELNLTKDNIAIRESLNPFVPIKTESGILLVGTGMSMSNETGQEEALNQRIRFGIVTLVGPDVKTVKVGDGVYYDSLSVRPIPYNGSVWLLNENIIMGYVKDSEGSIFKKVLDFEKEKAKQLKAIKFQYDLGVTNNLIIT